MEKYAERTFAKWAKRYGPVYHVKLGSYDTVVLNSYEAIEQVILSLKGKIVKIKICYFVFCLSLVRHDSVF